ncbi:hypothetical protein QC764_0015680 [Podospora pseudoanserina]|uniref:Uncharacterized protein n=1 Tax=Podospora pseudoanserina TaxID=2609844 RepID=A0ABR0IPN0_9PEZI|nr:hypothetical protein QC764_0015680 [Podospora pseudoanserina]
MSYFRQRIRAAQLHAHKTCHPTPAPSRHRYSPTTPPPPHKLTGASSQPPLTFSHLPLSHLISSRITAVKRHITANLDPAQPRPTNIKPTFQLFFFV